ncbi:MAG TPA: hypothetical protein EYP65_02350 [Armatimonadetes bacterium]|nr:hypothetical protein [Armatimonadota bacterium]
MPYEAYIILGLLLLALLFPLSKRASLLREQARELSSLEGRLSDLIAQLDGLLDEAERRISELRALLERRAPEPSSPLERPQEQDLERPRILGRELTEGEREVLRRLAQKFSGAEKKGLTLRNL